MSNKKRLSICYIFLGIILIISCENNDEPEMLKEIARFGISGRAAGEFSWGSIEGTHQIIDKDDTYLYVVDENNYRIQRFNEKNEFVDWIGYNNGVWGLHTANHKGDDNFSPTNIICRNSKIYVLHKKMLESEIMVLNKQGEKLQNIINPNAKSFNVDFDENLLIFESDSLNKYASNGEFIKNYPQIALGYSHHEFHIFDDSTIIIPSIERIIIANIEKNSTEELEIPIEYDKNGIEIYDNLIFTQTRISDYDQTFYALQSYTLNGKLVQEWKISPEDELQSHYEYLGPFIIQNNFLYEAQNEEIVIYSIH